MTFSSSLGRQLNNITASQQQSIPATEPAHASSKFASRLEARIDENAHVDLGQGLGDEPTKVSRELIVVAESRFAPLAF